MQCPDCGAVITSEDAFCGECGRPLQGIVPPAKPVTPAEVKDRATETVALPPSSPPPAKKPSRRLPLVIAAIAASLALCVCVVIVASLLVIRPGSETPPVLVLEVTATPESSLIPIYTEDFSDEGSGWDIFDEDNTTANYVDGEYEMGVFQDSYMAWGNPLGQDLDNFILDVDARTVDGPLDNNYGVLVRYQEGGSSFYWFQISADGFYAVDMLSNDEWVGLVDWYESDAINQGIGATNHIEVTCQGDQFSFSVNGTYLTSVSDPSFSSGNIGLAVGTFDEPGVVVRFDNLNVYSVQE